MSTVAFAALMGSALHAQAVDAGGAAQAAGEDQTAAEAVQAAEAAEDAPAGEIVVTGTRTRSAFSAPTPTQVVDAEALQVRGATSVVTLLQETPAINANRSSAATNGVRTQTPGQNFADLRGLGTPRTLVLVNGRRFIPTVPGVSVGNPYQVDINLIPSLMLDRVDIVTGGASAQWGSDAVAGVVNMILKRRVEGIQGEVQAGISQRGDYDEQRIGLVGGFSFADDRGHVVLSADYVRNGGIENGARAWARRFCYYFNDPASTLANGLPRMVLTCNAQAGNRTAGGLIVSATGGTAAQRAGLVGKQFDSATTVSPFVRGQFNPFGQTVTATTTTQTFSALQAGGNNPDQDRNSLFLALERKVAYGHADFDITDDINIFVQGSYGESTGSLESRPPRDQGGVYNPVTGLGSQVRIFADNAFIPAVLRPFIPQPAGAPGTTPTGQSFVMSRTNYDFPQPGTELTDKAFTITGGLEGKLGGGWTWDASYIHGQNDYIRNTFNTRDRQRYAQAVDAVRAPNGQIVCRSTLTNPSNGCVPLNIFGQGTPSQAAIDYVNFTAVGFVRYIQDAAQVNLQGNPFSTWAGEVSVAGGVEWRHESVNSTVDERSATRVADSSVGSVFSGDFSVIEGYLEATVPLASELPFAHSLAVNGAVRHARYSGDASAAAGQTTWKVGATWEPFDGLLLRATRSLDIRAPSLYELKVSPVTSNQNIVFNGQQFTGVAIRQEGNIDLVPERAKTLTVGGSFSPDFVPGLQLSIDYFNIRVEDVITTLGPIAIARNCDAGLTSFCSLLTFGPTQNLQAVSDRFLNLSSYKTSGLDFTMLYRFPVMAGELTLRGSATYTKNFTITTPETPPVVTEYAGMVGTLFAFSVPTWKATATATYEADPYSLSLQTRYVGPGRIDNLDEVATPTAQPDIRREDNRIGSYFVFNLAGTLDVLDDGRAQFFWNIDNIFDRDPPLIPNLSSSLQANGALHDVVGRYFRMGLRFKI